MKTSYQHISELNFWLPTARTVQVQVKHLVTGNHGTPGFNPVATQKTCHKPQIGQDIGFLLRRSQKCCVKEIGPLCIRRFRLAPSLRKSSAAKTPSPLLTAQFHRIPGPYLGPIGAQNHTLTLEPTNPDGWRNLFWETSFWVPCSFVK